jgi:peptidoglycan/xylan/chitin deacetylase (PgdA/CDA1 family)
VFAFLQRRQVALWDVEGRDWTAGDAATLARRLLSRVAGGSVILLHDGPPGTPALLDALLSGLETRGLAAVTLAELPARRITWRAALRRLPHSYGR